MGILFRLQTRANNAGEITRARIILSRVFTFDSILGHASARFERDRHLLGLSFCFAGAPNRSPPRPYGKFPICRAIGSRAIWKITPQTI
jgi:hypothetical protein